MINRLNATLNFMCTYEKVVTINKKIIDIIEEFNMVNNKVVLYGYNNTYEFIFSSVSINVDGTSVSVQFNGDSGGTISFR